MRLVDVFAVLVVLTFFPERPASAADAARCLNACSSQCYGAEKSQASQAACTQACASRCVAGGNAGTAVARQWGAIYIAKPPGEAIGWSFNAANSPQAQSIASRQCADANRGPCFELVTYFDKCATVVYALNSSGKVEAAFGKARANLRDAELEATAACRAKFSTCKVARTTCSRGAKGAN